MSTEIPVIKKKRAIDIIEKMHEYLDLSYPGMYNLERKAISGTEIDVILTLFDGKDEPPIIFTLKKVEDGIKLRIDKNHVFKKAREIRKEIYKLCGIGRPEEPYKKYRDVSEKDWLSLSNYLDGLEGYSLVESRSYFKKYLNPECEKFVLEYFSESKILLVKTGLEKHFLLVEEAMQTVTKIKIPPKVNLKALETIAYEKKDLLRRDIVNSIGLNTYNFIYQKASGFLPEFYTAYANIRKAKTLKEDTYNYIINSICRCYEGTFVTLLKTIDPYTLKDIKEKRDYVNITKCFEFKSNEPSEFKSYIFKCITRDDRIKLANVFKVYFLYRNPNSHLQEEKDYKPITDYEEALKIFNEIALSIKNTYDILSKYFF